MGTIRTEGIGEATAMKASEFIDVLKEEFKEGEEITFGILLDNGGVYPISDCSITKTDKGKALTFHLTNGTLAVVAMDVIGKTK